MVVLAIPYDAFAAKLASAIPFGEGPDLFVDSHERIGEYARRGFVKPVGDAIEQGAYVEVALTAVSHEGELFAVPLSLKSLALYVNDPWALVLGSEIPSTGNRIGSTSSMNRRPRSMSPATGRARNSAWASQASDQRA